MTGEEIIKVWEAWVEGKSRCPYCIDDDETFHSMCDCYYHERVCTIEGCLGNEDLKPGTIAEVVESLVFFDGDVDD